MLQILNSTDKNIKQAAIYIVLHINHMVQIADKKCANLTLKKILEGKKVYFDELVTNKQWNIDDSATNKNITNMKRSNLNM